MTAGPVSAKADVSALILAGGRGERLGGRPKALLEAGGETLLERVVTQAEAHASHIVVGLPAELVATGGNLLGARAMVITGGETRQGTFRNAFDKSGGDIVVVHDVARPFASPQLWEAVIAGAREHGAAAPAVALPVRDSLAVREGDWLGSPVDREALVAIQTPYAFHRSMLVEVLDAADANGWVENSVTTLVKLSGRRVALVPGEAGNTKVTVDQDWDEAARRISG